MGPQTIKKCAASLIDFQVANTWTKITARHGYAMVRNGKKPENPYYLSVAATFEKAITYVFAERLEDPEQLENQDDGTLWRS